jgi:hypothetical protein
MTFPHAHALLIGIGSYAQESQFNVPITATDANAVAEVLCNPLFCGYPYEQVTVLINAAASRDGVLAAFDILAARTSESDTVFIFYSGHGAYGDDDYYLTTHDTQLVNRKVVSGTGIREADLIEKLRAVKAKRLLLIVNACHSGRISPILALDEEPLTGEPLPPQISAALLGTGEGRVIISACREKQFSFVGPGPLTLFTEALVDGLQGKGVSSNRGYISVFDLYTHLYFALDEAVPRTVQAAVRQRYGDKQEPELTILKGVGPFAVALYRGATILGDFDASSGPPENTMVRVVNPAYSQAMLRQHQQSISSNAQVGAAIAGDVHGDVNVTQPGHSVQRSGINFGSGGQFGNITFGDVAGRDMIKTGDISGSGIVIGRGNKSIVHNVDTGGGDYAEGNIDNRGAALASGGQFNLSGNFSGAILNIKSTLTNVSQSINTAPHGDAATKVRLQALIEQLSAELQKVPAAQASAAEAVAETAKAAVEQATKAQPNKMLVHISAEGLKQAAQNLVAVLPTVIPVAEQIVDVLKKMVGA